MKKYIKLGLIYSLVLFACIAITYSVHKGNYREYTRSDAGPYITYPDDIILNWYDKIFAYSGKYISVAIGSFVFYLLYIGILTFIPNQFPKLKINKIIIFLLTIWLFFICAYCVATSQFGQSFLLSIFFGSKIFYGGCDNAINN